MSDSDSVDLPDFGDADDGAARSSGGFDEGDRILLWDLDGTIVDTSLDLATSVNAMLGHYGYSPLPVPVIVGHIGKGAQNLVLRCLEEHGHDTRGDDARDDDVEIEALRVFESHYATHLLDETRIYAGLETLLRDLAAAGRRMAVVTNKPEGFSRLILDHLGLSSCFLAVVGGETLPTRKPAPEPLWHAIHSCLAASGRGPEAIPAADGSDAGPLSAPLSSKGADGGTGETDPPRVRPELSVPSVMIGDTWIDAEAARAAGVPVILVGWGLGDRTRARETEPDGWAETTDELGLLLLPSSSASADGARGASRG